MKNTSPVYLDFNATTPIDSELAKAIPEALKIWGNPSSIHWAGQQSKNLIREARLSLATTLNVSPLELVFTSGGSESNNMVLKGVFEDFKNSERNEYITTEIEHPSVLKTFEYLERSGAKVHRLKVDLDGKINFQEYKSVLSKKTALVSVMLANNETGLIFPIKEMAAEAHTVGAYFHSDCVQAFGKIELDLKDLNIDFASFSAHKFYALKGSGILYTKKGSELPSLIFGGGQERHRRGGTENILGIFAMGFMAKKMLNISLEKQKLEHLRSYFESRVLAEISDIRITHIKAPRLPNTSSLIIDNIDGETLLMSLDVNGYAVSTGAACSSGSPEPSPVLLAIGLSRQEAQGSLRVSLGWITTEKQLDSFIETLKEVVSRLRKIKFESEKTVKHG